MMGSDWQKIKSIFNSAVELPTEDRAAYLDDACGEDCELRMEVEKLLGSYRSEFMEAPATENTINGRLAPGTRLGRYEILDLLGVGGMGEVYLATDGQLDRKVAIKVLNERYQSNEGNVRRFIQEAKAASALNHPNILTIHEIGQTETSHYIVSEFVDGHRLRTVLENGSVELSQILNIGVQVAEALSAAHAARIVHRDIKPENIVIRNDGYAKVLDFGLAKLLPERASLVGLEASTVAQNQTAKGLILGTVSYMSPEQAKGEPVDARTDIFSLGVLIYEMFTGRTPFTANSTSETLANLINRDPDPMSRFVNGVPDELQRIVSKMLRKDPDDRYQTMKGLLADFREFKDRTAIEAKLDRTSSQETEKATALLPRTTGDVAQVTTESKTRTPWYRRGFVLALVPALLIGILAFVWYWQQSSFQTQPQIRSLAVLPLENLSGDPSQEYFADGMTEALISNLSQIRELRVISRTSVMRYKSDRPPLPDIAKALGVDAIIEGSVVKSGNRVRITAQLIHGTSDAHLWTRNYEREISDILKLQSDVAQAVASEIRVRLTPAEQTRLASVKTVDPRAHEAYLLGKFHLAKTNEPDIKRAISYFESAIAIEPDYADAHAALAAAWLDLGIWGAPSLAEVESKVRESAAAAIRIDPGNAKARIAMCQLLNNYDYNWTAAEDEARRALELDPNDPEVLVTYSWLLQSLGRHDEVRLKMEKAIQLDPISARVQSAFGRMLYRARDYERAEIQLKRSIDLQPTSYGSYGRLADVYVEMGRFDDALAQLEKSNSIQPDGAHALRRAVVYARMGDRAKAIQALTGISHQSAWEMARLHTALGEATKAFEILNAAVDRRDTLLVHLKEDPSFVPLHSDPRWKPILRRLNFPDA